MRERFLSLKILFAVAMMLTLVTSASASPYSDAVIADNPTGYWRLDEVVGSDTAVNSHGDGEDGTAYAGVSFGHAGASSGMGTSARFAGNGDGSYVEILDTNFALDLEVGKPFTMEYWMNPEDLKQDGNKHVVSRADTTPNADAFIVNAHGGDIRFHTDGWGGGRHRSDSAGGVVVPANGDWYHVVGTYNGSNEMSLYVNGVLANTSTNVNVGPGAGPSGNVYFGTLGPDPAGGGWNWANDYKGLLDEVAIYNGVALSAAQVAAHYAAVPEPSTIVLLVFGPAMLWVLRRSR